MLNCWWCEWKRKIIISNLWKAEKSFNKKYFHEQWKYCWSFEGFWLILFQFRTFCIVMVAVNIHITFFHTFILIFFSLPIFQAFSSFSSSFVWTAYNVFIYCCCHFFLHVTSSSVWQVGTIIVTIISSHKNIININIHTCC